VLTARYLAALSDIFDLRSELAIRDQFLSIASHELKTPLTSIYGVLQLQERILKQSGSADERQLSYFRIVIRQTERLNELIDAMLDVSRIHMGRFLVEPTQVDAAPILRETVNLRLNVIAQEAGVRIELEHPQQLTAWIDPIRFEEVITNLGMNAIRFSPEGGVVWIRMREDGGSLSLTFRDQGPEVAESDRERIFRPFERAQRTGRLGGLGLGLFISRQIAQLHGGDVSLRESVSGRGNVFEARFPLRPPASS
jgi:signal transduction histidine kinase